MSLDREAGMDGQSGDAESSLTGPNSAEARILLAIRELRALRERELAILERIEGLIEERASVGLEARTTQAPAEDAPETRAEDAPELAEASSRSAGVPPNDAPHEPTTSPSAEGQVPSWIDAVVDAALAHAFSGRGSRALYEESDDEDESSEGSGGNGVAHNAGPASPVAPGPVDSRGISPEEDREPGSLLLLGSREVWAAIPWDTVERISLSDEGEGGRIHYCLQDLVLPGREPADEPYLISWRQGDDTVSLSTERLGEVLDLERAARQGVQAVLVPSNRGDLAPDVISLVEYAARVMSAQESPRETGSAAAPEAADAARAADTATAADIAMAADTATAADAAMAAGAATVANPATAAAPTFSATAPPPPNPPIVREEEPTALLAVRYLPARVAIARHLRTHGWNVVEAVDPLEVAARLRKEPFSAVFVETAEASSPEVLLAIRRVVAADRLVVGVGSRMRGPGIDALRDLGDIPRLFHPFPEIELERALGMVRRA